MNSLFDKPFTFDRVSRIVFGVLAIAGLLYALTILRNALLPFLIAWLMAYLMQPFVRFFQCKLKLKSRILAIIAVILTNLLLLIACVLILIPSMTGEIERIVLLLNTHNSGSGYIPFIPEEWLLYIRNNVNLSELMDLLSKENILNAVKQLAPRLWTLLSNTFSVLVSITIVFIIFLYFIFILLDYEKIANGWKELIPSNYRPFIKGLADDVELSMNRYFRGQALIAFCVGILFSIGFKIVGFPLGITLGVFMGVLNLVPYLQTIGIIPMLLLALLKSTETGENFWLILGAGILVLIIVQIIQDLFLTPRIMGKAMGLNPAIILLSLSVWGTLLGFIGLIVALPLTTLCLSYYKRFILMENNSKLEASIKEKQEEILKSGDE
ncbi:AI-2E family transporter [Massilibacteroides vaginae]|uniref:AI-2E family transporter n=1 Tax=Massilibacteroides vaginae TaxID=1673718 RepID=UPI000A1CE948|nr:AI-2E family transporter [Massilibacteroides vaginae]